MRLSISNIAWEPDEDTQIAELLASRGVDAIDVAPGKYFPDPASATDREVSTVKDWWSGHGIEIVGMQSLLFGTSGLNVFGGDDSQQAMLARLTAVCRIGAGLGATRLVFGSPRNRDRTGLDDPTADEIAVAFFRRVGDIAASVGVCVCLEPNPERYGANFMTTAAATADVVRMTDHPSIGLQLDIGGITISGEDLGSHLAQDRGLIRHIHASDVDLVPLGDGTARHDLAARLVQQHLPDHVVTIEMVATTSEPHVASVSRAVDVGLGTYGQDGP